MGFRCAVVHVPTSSYSFVPEFSDVRGRWRRPASDHAVFPTAQVGVIVVGAGPTGLGAATRINQHGVTDWVLVDQARLTAHQLHKAAMSLRTSRGSLPPASRLPQAAP